MASAVPKQFDLPDLSALDGDLVGSLALSMNLAGRGFPEGDAQHLVTAFVRSIESALRCYERARLMLVEAGERGQLIAFSGLE